VGTVKINAVFGGAPGGAAQPRRDSGAGFGYGPELLDEMTLVKVVHVGLPTTSASSGLPEARLAPVGTDTVTTTAADAGPLAGAAGDGSSSDGDLGDLGDGRTPHPEEPAEGGDEDDEGTTSGDDVPRVHPTDPAEG